MAREILVEESNVQRVDAPVTVCGDIHGQFYDLKELFKVFSFMIKFFNWLLQGRRWCPRNELFIPRRLCRSRFLLCRDFSFASCTQGTSSILPFFIILKVRYPDRITLIRGNHESRQITQVCSDRFHHSITFRYTASMMSVSANMARLQSGDTVQRSSTTSVFLQVWHLRVVMWLYF